MPGVIVRGLFTFCDQLLFSGAMGQQDRDIAVLLAPAPVTTAGMVAPWLLSAVAIHKNHIQFVDCPFSHLQMLLHGPVLCHITHVLGNLQHD